MKHAQGCNQSAASYHACLQLVLPLGALHSLSDCCIMDQGMHMRDQYSLHPQANRRTHPAMKGWFMRDHSSSLALMAALPAALTCSTACLTICVHQNPQLLMGCHPWHCMHWQQPTVT